MRKKNKKKEIPELIYNIQNIKCSVEVNSDVYDTKDEERITEIVNHMCKDIWIDRTYVDFHGNRWKDAFIAEEPWKEFNELVYRTDLGSNGSKKDNNTIISIVSVIVKTYLYSILDKYEYDIENIELSIVENSRFKISYKEDTRKNWNS